MAVTIRTFRASTIAAALRQVRDELGPGAIVLHTRTYRSGGFLGWRSKTWTEITASSAPPKANGRAVSAPIDRSAASPTPAPAVRSRAAAPSPEAVQVSVPMRPDRSNSPTATRDSAEGVRSKRDPRPAPPPPPRPAVPQREVTECAGDPQRMPPSLRDEMATIKRLVGQVLRTSNGHRHPGLPGALSEYYLALLESEVAGEIADQVVAEVRAGLSEADLDDRGRVQRAVVSRLASMIPVADAPPHETKPADGRPLTIALIGPTGVGKTTTLAKLAATYRLRLASRVGLVTCDTFRIAAVEQLRTYADIIGLPLKVAHTPAEMTAAAHAYAGHDLVLIDTAGRAPGDIARLDDTRRLLDAARPHQVHLVLSSAASEAGMARAIESFAPFKPTHLIFTKLDEAVNLGVLINTARRIDAKLSFLTTGQEVPDHIELGQAERLARLVLGTERVRNDDSPGLTGGAGPGGSGGAGGAR